MFGMELGHSEGCPVTIERNGLLVKVLCPGRLVAGMISISWDHQHFC